MRLFHLAKLFNNDKNVNYNKKAKDVMLWLFILNR